MSSVLFRDARLVNEGKIIEGDLLVKEGRIVAVGSAGVPAGKFEEVRVNGKWLMPGIIDDQVHFREPGLTHKANIQTESAAAVAGGVTSFMEMPNTSPPALTRALLEEKYSIAARTSHANYSFFMGASNDNLDEVLRTDIYNVCGIKAFMGSSTGNMLVDNEKTLEQLFAQAPTLIATHCEDEATVRANNEKFQAQYKSNATAALHPLIRSVEACYLSSSLAVNLAKRFDTRLHILHISTAKELDLFTNDKPLKDKLITAEVCVHHLSFDDSDYAASGNLIKCNPAIKSKEDREAIWAALLDNRLDIVATDHAPHTLEEKSKPYFEAPSGLPLIQHTLLMMLDAMHEGKITLEKIVEKMCHAPADCFRLNERGYLREGYWADLVIVDPEASYKVSKENILYKCGWSPLEGRTFKGNIDQTWVNGTLAWGEGKLQGRNVQRLRFR
jgi:dihydroorotase